jgi:propanediol dehydratase small subunit
MKAFSGKPVEEITVEAARAGDIAPDDLRIHPSTLEHQAVVAEQHENPQLAANLRRAAELTALGDADVLRIYEALRPHRSTAPELETLAGWLEERGATLNAALVREAAVVYTRRGLTT